MASLACQTLTRQQEHHNRSAPQCPKAWTPMTINAVQSVQHLGPPGLAPQAQLFIAPVAASACTVQTAHLLGRRNSMLRRGCCCPDSHNGDTPGGDLSRWQPSHHHGASPASCVTASGAPPGTCRAPEPCHQSCRACAGWAGLLGWLHQPPKRQHRQHHTGRAGVPALLTVLIFWAPDSNRHAWHRLLLLVIALTGR